MSLFIFCWLKTNKLKCSTENGLCMYSSNFMACCDLFSQVYKHILLSVCFPWKKIIRYYHSSKLLSNNWLLFNSIRTKEKSCFLRFNRVLYSVPSFLLIPRPTCSTCVAAEGSTYGSRPQTTNRGWFRVPGTSHHTRACCDLMLFVLSGAHLLRHVHLCI